MDTIWAQATCPDLAKKTLPPSKQATKSKNILNTYILLSVTNLQDNYCFVLNCYFLAYHFTIIINVYYVVPQYSVIRYAVPEHKRIRKLVMYCAL